MVHLTGARGCRGKENGMRREGAINLHHSQLLSASDISATASCKLNSMSMRVVSWNLRPYWVGLLSSVDVELCMSVLVWFARTSTGKKTGTSKLHPTQ